MFKNLSFLSVVSLSFLYSVGFIYDAACLEFLNLHFLQLLGTPLEYLAIGSSFIINKIAIKFTMVLLFLGLFACAFKPLERWLKEETIGKYIDIESIPIILISLALPLLLFLIKPIISTAQSDMTEFINKEKNNASTISYSKDLKYASHKGFIVRKRDKLILFYDVEKSNSILIPQRNVLHYIGPTIK